MSNIGIVTSKSSGKNYPVKLQDNDSWLETAPNIWEIACINVNRFNALEATQEFIDSQPDIF